MKKSSLIAARVSFLRALSSAALIWITTLSSAWAHEVLPSIADMTEVEGRIVFDIRANLESFVAGIDLTDTIDTNMAPEADTYDALRLLEPAALDQRFRAFWPEMAARINLTADGVALVPELDALAVGPVGNPEIVRPSEFSFSAALPDGVQVVQVGWDKAFGTLVIRQMGVDEPYDGYLEAGALSDPIRLAGGDQATGWESFMNYIPVGFDHILPKGLDHILFVLGLFFLSAHIRPLLLQISLFTLAHTLTLALAALGYVRIPGSIVEPLIAASIVFVALENIWARGISPWRPFVVFGFGLLHGLGFASVLGEFGLPEGTFIPALIGFNVGVELGQLTVIAAMFLCIWQALRVDRGRNEVGQGMALYAVLALIAVGLSVLNPAGLAELAEGPVWLFGAPLAAIFVLSIVSIQFRDHPEAYRRIVASPASAAIALVGAYWFVERVFL